MKWAWLVILSGIAHAQPPATGTSTVGETPSKVDASKVDATKVDATKVDATTAALQAVIATAPACEPVRATCIGIQLHVPVTDAGPIATAEWIDRQLAAANTHFEPLDVAFQFVGVSALPATAERVEDKAERRSFGALINQSVIDVFVTGHLDDIDKPGEMAYGVAWWTTGDHKLIILSTQAWERTLAHELGHVFGLKHSKYAVSIMNKKPRKEPPIEERTFHAKELAKMKPVIREMVRSKRLKNLAAKKPAAKPKPRVTRTKSSERPQ